MAGADDRETLQPVAEPGTEHELVPALTILGHPDVERVGERVRLTELRRGREIALSRNEPLFAAPGKGHGRALLDPYVSRRAVSFVAAPRGVAVPSAAPGLANEGAAVTGTLVVTRAELKSGVVIALA